jgi:acyl-homoserine lactone acylase PvdQ
MARHMGPGLDPLRDSGEPPFRVFHGPAFRLIVDLADPDHTKFVIAGGNGGSLDGEHMLDHYPAWLSGDYYTLTLNRDEIDVEERWHIEAQ